jgi:hypothetical protein
LFHLKFKIHMANNNNTLDLLNPADFFRKNYIHQVKQTIDAYSKAMIVLGEALQNAIDAVCDETAKIEKGEILISIDFDTDTVTIKDNGLGFPKEPSLLYLGGTLKTGTNSKGKIGVGIKVTLFSSNKFCLRSKLSDNENWKMEIPNADKFEESPSIKIPNPPLEDPNPLIERGTEVAYSFKRDNNIDFLNDFIIEIKNHCIPREFESAFFNTITELNTGFPSPFAALLSSYIRRFSYAGDVLARSNEQRRYPKNGILIRMNLKCSSPKDRFGEDFETLYGNIPDQSFNVEPSYLIVEDTLKWVPKGKKAPLLFSDKLGRGGENLQRTDGFNSLIFNDSTGYESLLLNKKGNLPNDIDTYKKDLFPLINKINLTIGRIPDFEKFLPGGSRRVISCNGVITSHDIDLTRGRNQEYVRCFDLVIDVNANLNYGKTQLTNLHLVKKVKDYINEAYVRVIQSATSIWVGKLPNGISDEDTEVFVGRVNLGLDDYITIKEPKDENDVIGLFFEMGGKKIFNDYRIYGLTQKATYDCKAAIKRECDDDKILSPNDDTKLRTIEFKVLASEVIRDFDRF